MSKKEISIQDQLKTFLLSAKDWDKMDSNTAGVSIVKIPATKTKPAYLSLEFNPILNGKPVKRKGLFISSKETLVSFGELLNDDKSFQLISELDKVNPKETTTKKLIF